MPSGVRDIQLLELKDTISQLNNTISTQNELIRSLQEMLQERGSKSIIKCHKHKGHYQFYFHLISKKDQGK